MRFEPTNGCGQPVIRAGAAADREAKQQFAFAGAGVPLSEARKGEGVRSRRLDPHDAWFAGMAADSVLRHLAAPKADTTRLSAFLEGRYRIERELGQGGMATVYLAEDDLRRTP